MVVVVVLSLRGFFDTTRALSHYEAEVRSAQHDLGETMQIAVRQIWQAQGWEAALEFLHDVEQHQTDTQIRWIWLEEQPHQEYRPRIPVEDLRPLIDGDHEINIDRSAFAGYVVTYKPVALANLPLGALEFTRSTAKQTTYAREEVHNQVLTNLFVILVYALVSSMLGRRLVARPIQALIDHARRVGEGDFTVPSNISQRDEIGQLAIEMNRMSGKLLAAKSHVNRERQARIEVESQLRHADRLASVGRLAASFVHDVGTPLNVISGCASLVAEGEPDSDKVKDYAQRIADQASRIDRMIRRFLDFARKDSPERTRTSLSAIARGAASLLETVAKKSRVRITIAEGPDAEAKVDPAQIQQLLANLLMNAIQAMPEGGQVTIAVKSANGEASIEVSDEGTGIPEADRERVFEPFFTTKSEGQGTGLGLSVSKSIVESHGGRIELTSSPSGGARFTFYLPQEGSEP